ncbi:GntR family transcriptional regulator [Streptomyces vietnamensis]|uniref:GntR family transcriptional regulator n=1 Tax=Streptomyces vietnamensis TaxID=362257 RepID=UPI0034136CEF
MNETNDGRQMTDTRPGKEPTYSQLRSTLTVLAHIGRRYDREHGGDVEAVREIVKPWLPVAEGWLREAAGSPSDQARWQALIEQARQVSVGSEQGFIEVSTAARRLVRALTEATRSGPRAQEIADRLRDAITTGAYPTGSMLSRVRTRLGFGVETASAQRVDLALQDLADGGLATILPSNVVRVAAQEPPCDPVDMVADWLRVLIAAGVYAPSSSLPKRQDLARILASPRHVVSAALQVLHDEGLLSVQRSTQPVVRPVPPFPLAGPPEVGSLITRLQRETPAGDGVTPSGLRQIARRTRAWQAGRTPPPSGPLHHAHEALLGAASRLLPLAAHRYPGETEVESVLRRAAITVLRDWPTDPGTRIWQVACLASAVLDVLDLVEGTA